MTRPKCCRKVGFLPARTAFGPLGMPGCPLREVALTVDELEAIRLADHEGLYQEQAALEMGVSRQTFGRIVEVARRKVAKALVEGLVLRIEGGEIEMVETREFKCADCGHAWEVRFGIGRPAHCPACESANFHRAPAVLTGDGGRGACCRRHRGGQAGSAVMQQGMRRRCRRGRARPGQPGDTTDQKETDE